MHNVTRCTQGLPLAVGEVAHADMYHDVEVLIVDVSGVKVEEEEEKCLLDK